ncbi:MAG: endo-1,4-beta-xylanase [Planctomycetaceae bacterium]|nr:endo-1,4-beta-xylanase [Planctomycetaceae bacterium]
MKKTLPAILSAAVFLFLTVSAVSAADWKSEADARIEKHRKENVRITVTQNGKPVNGASLEFKMQRNEFLFGSNIFMFDRFRDKKDNAAYGEQFAAVFNFATLGFYWSSYESRQGQPNDAYAEKVVRWCQEHRIRTKGHPLVWNTGDPGWIKEMPTEELFRVQTGRAKTCTEHFRGQINTWDVINEVTEWQRKDMQQRSPKLTELGKSVGEEKLVRESFAAARQGNPDATLLINDYVTDNRYAALLDKFVADGKPLFDAIGIQSHMHSGVWNNQRLWETCERFARFGVPLHFTELTVMSLPRHRDWEKADSTPEGETFQRTEVERIYTMLFSHPSVAAITWWDFSDQGAWMNAPSGLVRKDMSPKPAYHALKKLITEDWTTNIVLKTDTDGRASVRAFRGDYQVIASLPDGTKKEFPVSVQKGEANQFEWDMSPSAERSLTR